MTQYCRRDALRIFGIREGRLRLWERNGLIACAESYSFQELGQLRKLHQLSAQQLSACNIRDSVHAMRSVSGLSEPLLQAGLDLRGTRQLVFRHSGAVMEPIGGQYLLDFAGSRKRPISPIGRPAFSARERDREIARLFSEAVRQEEGGRPEAAVEAYESVLALAPGHPASAINLGTLSYARRDFPRAEQFYRMATESDPQYALAFFDLGNVLDELKRLREAIEAYRRAVSLRPRYADAHYNLALALERHGQRRSALRHWSAYLRLDATGIWAEYARAQRRKTLAGIGLQIMRGKQEDRTSRVSTTLRVV